MHRLFVLGVLLLAGCAITIPAAHQYQAASLGSISVDAFLLVVDDSSSMGRNLREEDGAYGPRGIDVVLSVATAVARSIPDGSAVGGVRSFGQGPCLPHEGSSLLSGMDPYLQAAAMDALAKIECQGGYSPLSKAFNAAQLDFAGLHGSNSVIVITDGLDMGKRDVRAAAKLHEETGACISAIQIGNRPAARTVLEQIAAAAGCGVVVSAKDLEDPDALRAFLADALNDGNDTSRAQVEEPVREVVADSTTDTDGDGVNDNLDACPNTPRGVPVKSDGCPRDSDGDGITDDIDACPRTSRGTPVDANGCALRGIEVTEEGGAWRVSGEVLFGFNSDALREEAKELLSGIAGFLQRNGDVSLDVEGHTDDVGPAMYNKKLSLQRATTTVDYIVAQGVSSSRLFAIGKGETSPLVANDSDENRQLNRRVEFRPRR